MIIFFNISLQFGDILLYMIEQTTLIYLKMETKHTLILQSMSRSKMYMPNVDST